MIFISFDRKLAQKITQMKFMKFDCNAHAKNLKLRYENFDFFAYFEWIIFNIFIKT